MMNRAQRRDLKRRMKARGHVTVTLKGGPMDGWVVKPGAPALQSDWRARWLEEMARGAYEAARPGIAEDVAMPLDAIPTWEQIAESERDAWRAGVHQQFGGGRYVLASEGITATWEAG